MDRQKIQTSVGIDRVMIMHRPEIQYRVHVGDDGGVDRLPFDETAVGNRSEIVMYCQQTVPVVIDDAAVGEDDDVLTVGETVMNLLAFYHQGSDILCRFDASVKIKYDFCHVLVLQESECETRFDPVKQDLLVFRNTSDKIVLVREFDVFQNDPQFATVMFEIVVYDNDIAAVARSKIAKKKLQEPAA